MPVLLGVPAREMRSNGAATTLVTTREAARIELNRNMMAMAGVDVTFVVDNDCCARFAQRASPCLYSFLATRLRGQINM